MRSNWQVKHLGELYEFSSGLSKPKSAFGSGYPFLTFKDVFDNYFVPSQLSELVESNDRERESCSIRRGDVFLTRTSETDDELGMSSVALETIPEATFNGFTKRLRPREATAIYPRYAGYYFRSPHFRAAVTAMANSSTRASLNNEMLARLSMVLPPPAEQEAIANILGALDDKVRSNSDISETLQAILHTEYEGLVQRTREAGLGRSGRLGDLVSPFRQRVGRDRADMAVVYSAISTGELVPSSDHFRKRVHSSDISKYLAVERWDFAYNPSRINIGSIGMLFDDVLGAVSPVYVVARSDVSYRWYVWHSLRSPVVRSQIAVLASGSVRQSLSFADFASIECWIPDEASVREFEHATESLRLMRAALATESATLSQIRDTLLPRLLSGELRPS